MHTVSSVRLPARYTAMEGDIEVSFTLDRPNAFEYNAIVHLEYLEGDAAVAAADHLSSARKLTSLPVPLGLQRGTVVFVCGTLKRAGPHRAYLTVNGERIAESAVLQVAWPPVAITAPSRLETYSTDVSVTVAFTRDGIKRGFRSRSQVVCVCMQFPTSTLVHSKVLRSAFNMKFKLAHTFLPPRTFQALELFFLGILLPYCTHRAGGIDRRFY